MVFADDWSQVKVVHENSLENWLHFGHLQNLILINDSSAEYTWLENSGYTVYVVPEYALDKCDWLCENILFSHTKITAFSQLCGTITRTLSLLNNSNVQKFLENLLKLTETSLEQKILMNTQLDVICVDMVDFTNPAASIFSMNNSL